MLWYADAVSNTAEKSRFHIPVVIQSGTSISSAAILGDELSLIGFYMPSAWSTAAVQASVSKDGVTYVPLQSSPGTVWSVNSPSNYYCYYLDNAVFEPWSFVKMRSGTSGTPVNQSQTVTLTLVAKALA
jgi:hypothetical protein